MDIRNVGNNGGIERSGERPQRAQRHRQNEGVSATPVRDEAKISDRSRAAANAVEAFAERAKNDDAGRDAVVAGALARLQSGELDSEAVYRETAKRLLDGKFSSV